MHPFQATFGNLHFSTNIFETALGAKMAGISATWHASKAITAAARGQEVKMCGNFHPWEEISILGREVLSHTSIYFVCMEFSLLFLRTHVLYTG